ncbi:MAG TPA: hypothetical protein VGC76_12455 [Pyrinomonadaceae bacterium]|jgi:hypothetical protein
MTVKKTRKAAQHKESDLSSAPRQLSKRKIEDYSQSQPTQLKLFELLQPTESNYSNTIELYDFMPKYVWGKVERIQEKFLEPVEREFECRGVRYRVRIVPARVKDSDGVSRDYLPGKREELVEDALRKIATEGQGIFLDDEAAVTFTLYQLQQELKRTGHSYSITQLKESLMICVGTLLHLTDENEQAIFASSLFNTIGLQTREDWEGQGEKSKAFVRFNALVTTSIRNRTFRQFNYEVSMGYQNVISRQLHKRLSHHYTQASLSQPYNILLTTIIRDFGLKNYEKISHNLRDVEMALKEMVQEDVILKYEQDKIMDPKKGNKILDVRLMLTPHPKFINEVIKANNRQKELREADVARLR